MIRTLFDDYGVSYSSSFLGFVIIMAVARLLGAEEFAWVSAGVAFGGFLIPLSALGSDLTFVRDAVAAPDRRIVGQMAARTFGMRVTVMAALLTFLLFCTPVYAGSIENGVAIALISGWAGLQGLYPAAWFDYLGQTRIQNRLVFAERTGTLALMFCLWLLPSQLHSAMAVGLVLMASRLASVLVQVRMWTIVSGIRDFRFRLVFPRESPGIDIRVTAALVANAGFIYGNQLFLANNRLELASYGLAFQIMGLISVFQSQALRLVSVTIAEVCKRRGQILRSIMKYAALIGGGSAVLGAAALLIIRLLPFLLSDRGFESASLVAPTLCVWVVVAGAGLSVVQHLLALKEQAFYLRTSILGGTVGLLLGAIFAPRYGAISVALILLGVQSLTTLINLGKVFAVSAARAARPA